MSNLSAIDLNIIGSAALMLQANYKRGTKDSDILKTEQLTPEVEGQLIDLAGPDSVLHKKYRMYIDVVHSALPFLPQTPKWNPLDNINTGLRCFQIFVLDIVDVVVSKLKRYNSNDVFDIDQMVDLGYVDHQKLVHRFKAAIDYNSMDARAVDFPKYVSNLNRVERDLFGVGETEIELPECI